jgi:diguanylate cyclase (GGDEF)-like protein
MHEDTNRPPMNALDPDLLAEVLRHAPDAVAVVEGTQPDGGQILYANSTLALLLQRPDQWPLGRKLGEIETSGSVGAAKISSAPVSLVCADGTRIGCERFESRLSADRVVVFYRPIPKLAFETTQALPSLSGNNGLATREHLLEVLRRDWSIAQRDGRQLTVMRFDLDAFRTYIEIYGRMAADNVLRQVAKTIVSSMRRTSDVVARFDDDEFVVLGVSMEPPSALSHAEQILGRVRALAVHHPRSPTGRYLTMSCGIVTGTPGRNPDCESILETASKALLKAKTDGGNRVIGGELK